MDINEVVTAIRDTGAMDHEEVDAAVKAVVALRAERAAQAAKAARLEQRRAAIAVLADGDSEELAVFVANQNSDLTEGRGGYVARGHFLFKEDADKANYVLEGAMGTANDCKVTTMVVFTSFDEWLNAGGRNTNKARLNEVLQAAAAEQGRLTRSGVV